ncbi:hypothetical protein PHMEG_00026922 [Phytophthora megakarya]|uniref:Uncharacterized protein n=1 Tax=Phytophthora megakarya TaxID=4795 RepID=A0A225VB24_9STRA|nr:hypothetical protein PHMEG_00026922 [Phytophthora megakarya]
MDTPITPRDETAQDLGGNLGETAQDRGKTDQDSDAPVKRLQVVDLLHGSTSGSDRPSISAADDFNARNAAQNLLSTLPAKATFLTELDGADTKARSVVATPSVAGLVPPVQITSPQSYWPYSTTQFVGVPAFDVDRLGIVLLRDSYGGLENLVEIEHLSDQDKADLSKLLSEDQDIQRELLVPRDASVEFSPSDFRHLVTDIPAQRELAALGRVYEPQGLARKVFGMSTPLKRMLDKHRVSLVTCTLGTSKMTLELDNSSDEARCAHRDFALLKKAFNQQVVEILEQAQSRLSESDRDFQRAAEEHSRQEQVLRDENAELHRQLEDHRLVNRQLEDRPRGGTFKVGRVMNFLNRHNARVSGNWPCLKALLERFKDGSLPPDAWKTQIQINAADEFDADPGAYEYEVESDDEESKVPEVPKPQVTLKMSTCLRPEQIDTLCHTTAKQLSVIKAREGLTQPIIWDKLRADIQKLMRSHMPYDEALAAVRANAEIHSHLDARHLISMLEAESKLTKALTSAEVPTRWPNLRKDIQDDAVGIMAALYDSVTEVEDDEGRDATFSPGDDGQNKPQRRTTPPRQAKRGNDKKSRPGQERKQTALARKSYGSLSDSEKWIVEAPGQGILSWRHRGVLMKFPPGTANAVAQSFGFPDYAPNFAKDEDVQALRKRWDPVVFKELMDTNPWAPYNLKVVFARESLDAIVALMSVHRRAIWWFGHWVFIDLETDDPYSVELHRERKAECYKAKK